MNRRDSIFQLLHDSTPPAYVPAGFFIHFDKKFHVGQAAIDKHLEYFHYTGMDFVKIQYELTFPQRPEIGQPADWKHMPFYGKDFYAPQLAVVKGLVKAVGKAAPVIVTVYSPFMCAGHTVGGQSEITRHISEDPQAVQAGMEIITASLGIFVAECIALGVDGFYASTQGNESFRFSDPSLFGQCVKPYDLALMAEMNRGCDFNILHICDYHGGYDDLGVFGDYPGQVVNCSQQVGKRKWRMDELSTRFGRPFMGGVERKGIIATGSEDDVRQMVEGLLAEAPPRYILAADCTLPNDVPWGNIRAAIDTAHSWGK
ncbi:MAG: hypothetical protein KJZ86_07300 [Caldilineaceae bacterium]|nr:hypothetical protein [Caldilineaceae bacterium]HRJ41606.1 uroporphyrinogen decarboxylase family protein [Caldilineaceae bacterium]